jgi:cellulose synthase operon protein C
MPTDALDPIDELLEAVNLLSDPAAQIDLVERAVGMADARGDVDHGFAARRTLVDLAAYALRYDLYGVTFAWLFAQAVRRPDRFPVADLLGQYQDVISKLVNFPEFPRAQYEALFEDVRRHFVAHGFSLRPLYVGRRSVAIDFGDPAMAQAADREWRRHRRDPHSDSPGMEALRQLQFEDFVGDFEAAARTIDRWFADPGREAFYDDQMAGDALLPLLRLGRAADAVDLHRRSWRKIRPGRGYIWSWGPHLSFLGLTGNLDRGARLFQTLLPVALGQSDLLSRFHFLEHALVLFRSLVAGRPKAVRLRVPESVPWYHPDGRYEPAAVLDWIDQEADAIARRFDERNGNTYHADLLAERRGMDRFARPCPAG